MHPEGSSSLEPPEKNSAFIRDSEHRIQPCLAGFLITYSEPAHGCMFKPLNLWPLVTQQEKMNTGHWPALQCQSQVFAMRLACNEKVMLPQFLGGPARHCVCHHHLLWLFPLNSNITPPGRPFLNFFQPVDHFLSVGPCSS